MVFMNKIACTLFALLLFFSCKKEKLPVDFYEGIFPIMLNFNTSNSPLLSNKINRIYKNEEIIWLASDSGLYQLKNNTWKVYTTSNSGLVDNGVNAITEKNGVLWFGTNKGLCKFDGNNWIVYNAQNSPLPVNRIRSLTHAPNGDLWIGTFSGGGLCKFDGTNWQIFTPANSGLPNNSVAAVEVDASGVVWASTGGGLTRFDGTNWTVYRSNNSGLPNNQVYCISFEGNKKWIGTNGGVAVFDDVSWKSYTSDNSQLPLDLIRAISIAVDDMGKKYIATEGKGIAIIDKNENWEIIDTQNKPLKSGYISSVLKVENKLWIASQDNGLMLTIEK
jgi:ligand-binding sensor domain-containing protein